MTGAWQIIADIAALGGAAGFVTLMIRAMRKLITRIESVAEAIGGYPDLRKVTAQNTLAIERLTREVRALTQVEQQIANGTRNGT